MNLIDMTDRDKIFYYATNYTPINFRIMDSKQNMDSYYIDSDDNSSTSICDIMEYNIEHFGHIKQYLNDLFGNGKVGFKDIDLLTKIIAATTIKNMPSKVSTDSSKNETVQKESYESVAADDSPPVFVYEF